MHDNGDDDDDWRSQSSMINPLEYEHLALALKSVAEADHDQISKQKEESSNDKNNDDFSLCEESYAFSPSNLAGMTSKQMTSLLKPYLKKKKTEGEEEYFYLDNIETRSKLWNEIGRGLIDNFEGSAIKFIAAAEGQASKMVELMLENFPGFRDISTTSFDDNNDNGHLRREIYFLKRAQIFVGDINAALDLNLEGMDQLTTFADYRVPQILRHYEVIEYNSSLSSMVDTGKEILKDSTEELSIRAATVIAVEELVDFLNSMDSNSNNNNKTNNKVGNEEKESSFTAVNVDWYLWQVGERMHQEKLLKPFHKVRTQFY